MYIFEAGRKARQVQEGVGARQGGVGFHPLRKEILTKDLPSIFLLEIRDQGFGDQLLYIFYTGWAELLAGQSGGGRGLN